MYSDSIHIDRDSFIHWIDGELIHFEKGEGFIVNETECMEADDELIKGNTVVLMVNRKPFSIIQLVNDKVVETKIE